jgi:hypothetical protein
VPCESTVAATSIKNVFRVMSSRSRLLPSLRPTLSLHSGHPTPFNIRTCDLGGARPHERVDRDARHGGHTLPTTAHPIRPCGSQRLSRSPTPVFSADTGPRSRYH